MPSLHPDLTSLRFLRPILSRPLLPFLSAFMKAAFRLTSDKAVTVTHHAVPTAEGSTVPVAVIAPKGQEGSDLPGLFLLHGGAFCLRASGAHHAIAKAYALRLGCRVIFPDYPLAPRHPYPTPLEDAFAAFRWAVAQQKALHLRKLVIGGDSAGGNLAIGVTLLAMEHRLPLPEAALLIYPVTDRRMRTASMEAFQRTPLWNAPLNRKMWTLYLPEDAPRPELASPMEYPSLAGFPPTYLEVAQLDCLRDEGLSFADRLAAEGVAVETHLVEGACHGFDTALHSSPTRAAMGRRVDFLQKWMA